MMHFSPLLILVMMVAPTTSILGQSLSPTYIVIVEPRSILEDIDLSPGAEIEILRALGRSLPSDVRINLGSKIPNTISFLDGNYSQALQGRPSDSLQNIPEKVNAFLRTRIRETLPSGRVSIEADIVNIENRVLFSSQVKAQKYYLNNSDSVDTIVDRISNHLSTQMLTIKIDEHDVPEYKYRPLVSNTSFVSGGLTVASGIWFFLQEEKLKSAMDAYNNAVEANNVLKSRRNLEQKLSARNTSRTATVGFSVALVLSVTHDFLRSRRIITSSTNPNFQFRPTVLKNQSYGVEVILNF